MKSNAIKPTADIAGKLSYSKIFVVAISDAMGVTSDMAEMQHFGEDDPACVKTRCM